MSSGSKKTTIGYRYSLGEHLALVHGPVDKCTRLRWDERVAWEGSSTGGRINVDAANLFGGDKREGGVSGAIDFETGAPAQGRNSYLQARLGTEIPAFRGVASLVFRQLYLGNNPYLKPMDVRLQRIHVRQDGLAQWYPEKAAIGQENFLFTLDGADAYGRGPVAVNVPIGITSTSQVGKWRYLTYTSSGAFSITSAVELEILLVGGGGGIIYPQGVGAGGGGGQVVVARGLFQPGTYFARVGLGGPCSGSTPTGQDGQDSFINTGGTLNAATAIVTAMGGAGNPVSGTCSVPADTSTKWGGAGPTGWWSGACGSIVPGQQGAGTKGGNNGGPLYTGGGGGGGACGNGGDADAIGGGESGAGVWTNFTGTELYLAPGGSGFASGIGPGDTVDRSHRAIYGRFLYGSGGERATGQTCQNSAGGHQGLIVIRWRVV